MNAPTMSTTQADELYRQQKQQRLETMSTNPNVVVESNTNEQVEKNVDQSVDINENNSYNNDVVETTTQQQIEDPEIEKLNRVFSDTFKGDPTKAVKSWMAAQSSFQKVDRELRDAKQQQDLLLSKLQENPRLFDLVQKALNDEHIDENLLVSSEPTSQPQPNRVNELVTPIVDVDEQELVQAGLLDPRRKAILSPEDWTREVLRAETKYLPQKAAKEFAKQIEQQEQTRQQQMFEQQIRSENTNRFAQSLEETAGNFGLDFTGEHQDLLSEIETLVFAFRDPKDPANLIHPKAVEYAYRELMQSKGVVPKQVERPVINTDIFDNTATPPKAVTAPKGAPQKLAGVDKYVQEKRQQRVADIQRHRDRFINKR